MNNGRSFGDYTRETREWLNQRFDVADREGVYVPNQPSYGFSAAAFRLEEYARTAGVLHALDRLRFDSLLDAGSADGYFPALIRKVYGIPVFGADLSNRAILRGRQMYSVPGAAFDIHAVPFASGSVDVVTCTEVLEHVVDPVTALAELLRVARHAVVVSTPRARNDAAVETHFQHLDPGEPHAHIHYLTDQGMKTLVENARKAAGCTDAPQPVYRGARNRLLSRWYDRVAWESDDSVVQRQAYLEFTLTSTDISPASRQAVQHAMIDRYTSAPSAWKRRAGGMRWIRWCLSLDAAAAAHCPSLAHDHLVVIPLNSHGIPGPHRMGMAGILKTMIESFTVPKLRIIPREDSSAQS